MRKSDRHTAMARAAAIALTAVIAAENPAWAQTGGLGPITRIERAPAPAPAQPRTTEQDMQSMRQVLDPIFSANIRNFDDLFERANTALDQDPVANRAYFAQKTLDDARAATLTNPAVRQRWIAERPVGYCWLAHVHNRSAPMARYYAECAARGNFTLGLYDFARYLDTGGNGVPIDRPRAAALYKQAADRGDARAAFEIGTMLSDGDGIPKNEQAAVRYFRLAGEGGVPEGAFNFGLMMRQGRGTPVNQAEAARQYRIALDGGFKPAAYSLAIMYDLGEGIATNKAEAARLYRIGAAEGYGPSQAALASMYERGEGVAQNWAEAIRLYRLAADQNIILALNNLGRLYLRGDGGLQRDRARGVQLMQRAARLGGETAKSNLRLLGETW